MSVRILHFSDAHIGVETYGRIDPSTGLSTRLLDYMAVLDQAVDRALAGDVDLVVFTGDAYRGRDPSPTHQREFARRLLRLSQAKVPVYLLVGNHDLPAATGRASTVDIFDTLQVPGVFVGREPGMTLVPTKYGPIQVVGLPWITRSLLISKGRRDLVPERYKEQLGEFVATFIQGSVARLDPRLPSVLCAHLLVIGAHYGSEQSAMLGQDVILPRSVVADPAFGYVALGHVHRQQAISTERPVAWYAGSLERVDFGEEGEKKGYLLVDVGTESTTVEQVFVNAREFVTVRIDASDTDPTDAALREIQSRRTVIDGAIVRLEITTTPERESSIDHAAIRAALSSAYHVAGISKRIERLSRSRVPDISELTPTEALRAYVRSREMSEDHSDAVLARGIALIAELDGAAQRPPPPRAPAQLTEGVDVSGRDGESVRQAPLTGIDDRANSGSAVASPAEPETEATGGES